MGIYSQGTWVWGWGLVDGKFLTKPTIGFLLKAAQGDQIVGDSGE